MKILKKGKLENDLYWVVADGAFSLNGYYLSNNSKRIDQLFPLLNLTTPGGIVLDGWSIVFEHGNGTDLLVSKSKPDSGRCYKTIGFDTMGMWHRHWKPDEVAYACQEGYHLAQLIKDKDLAEYYIQNQKNGKYLLIDNIYVDWVDKEQASTFHIFDNLTCSQKRIASFLKGKQNLSSEIRPENLRFVKKECE